MHTHEIDQVDGLREELDALKNPKLKTVIVTAGPFEVSEVSHPSYYADCPPGTKVVGGGFVYQPGGAADEFHPIVIDNYPVPGETDEDPGRWRVRVLAYGPEQFGTLYVHAVAAYIGELPGA